MSTLNTVTKDKLLTMIEIQGKVVKESSYLHSSAKELMIEFGEKCSDKLRKEHFTSTQLKSAARDLLTYWNESIGVDTEIFWSELKEKHIDFERKDELKFALEKRRFRRVDQGIGARNGWSKMRNLQCIKSRFSTTEIKEIGSIIEKDEQTRFAILKKCLAKKAIPPSQYLKFGECMAYFDQCNLFEKYLNKEQVDELYAIW